MYLSVFFGGIYEFIFFRTIPNYLVFIGSFFTIIGGLYALLDKKEAIKLSKKTKKKG
jgi:hypothetical protein